MSISNEDLAVYSLFVALTHMFFSIMVLRLYQLVKIKKVCEDTLWLRLGVILVVTGSMTVASMPIHDFSTGVPPLSFEPMFWSLVRTTGLLIVSFVILAAVTKHSRWDGVERRTTAREDARVAVLKHFR